MVDFRPDAKFEAGSDNLTVGPRELEATSDATFSSFLVRFSLFNRQLETGTEFASACTEESLDCNSKFSCSLKKSISLCSSDTGAGASSMCNYEETPFRERLVIFKAHSDNHFYIALQLNYTHIRQVSYTIKVVSGNLWVCYDTRNKLCSNK